MIQNLKEELARAVAQSRVAAIYSTIGKITFTNRLNLVITTPNATIDLNCVSDEESNHDVSSLLSTVGRSLAMLASANQRSQECVTDLPLEINRILSKHNLDVHKRCVQDFLDIKQVPGKVIT